ncbi:hypothetical protein H2O64_16450 [Kordia sp. YSTF-M3]|uniref:Uncharacterized protein n=1 Tax=Kordia aestuariivivens TaxID=2759037 RepID=A0ABR7QCG2_9FLAO|nr:hypothetical protein [Kordia aestuariivivens]MBC8756266.1 hypothetical protein [Kordia aestuariivivens]
MKKHLLLFIFVLSTVVSFAQDKPTPYPDFVGQQLDAIESNPNWKLLTKATGDLTNDTIDDVVIVIESKEDFVEIRCADCPTSLSKARIILVLLCKNDVYTVHIQNNEFIPRSDEGGMASQIEPDIRIENNQLTIHQEYTRSQTAYIFEYQKDLFNIVSAESNSVHAASGDTRNSVFDFSKNEITITEGNISNEEEELKKEKVTVIKFDKKAKPLSEFKAMYEWEIVKYYNL